MFVRMAQFQLDPERASAAIRQYVTQGVPRVKACVGNLDCYLLEPVVEGEAFMACTLWASEADAKAYEVSGLAQEVASLLRVAFVGAPVLKTYRGAAP